MKELIEFAKQFIAKHPQHKEAVKDLIQLCSDEIEEGSPATHEIQLCRNSIEQLLEK